LTGRSRRNSNWENTEELDEELHPSPNTSNEIKWAGYALRESEMINTQVMVGKVVKSLLVCSRGRWKNFISMDLREEGCDRVN
jgi:hypothetical protein